MSPKKKKQRLMLLARANNDEEEEDNNSKAREVMKEMGFDPEDATKECRGKMVSANGQSVGSFGPVESPMNYFTRMGDKRMCRYIFSRCGAVCNKPLSSYDVFPMYTAALRGDLDLVQLLFYHCGAKKDIRKQDGGGNSPLRVAFERGHDNVAQFLILHEAWAPLADGVYESGRPTWEQSVQNGVIDDALMRNDLRQLSDDASRIVDKRLSLLSWAQDAVTTYANVKLFFKGTVVSSSHKSTASKSIKVSPPLVLLNGKDGILELIGEYCGNPKVHDLRIFRQLIQLLPAFIADVPFTPFEEEEEEY